MTREEKIRLWTSQVSQAKVNSAMIAERKEWLENGLLKKVMEKLAASSSNIAEFRKKLAGPLAYIVTTYELKEEANDIFLQITKNMNQ